MAILFMVYDQCLCLPVVYLLCYVLSCVLLLVLSSPHVIGIERGRSDQHDSQAPANLIDTAPDDVRVAILRFVS